MSQYPFIDLSLRFPGFSPVVEADACGQNLVFLPEQTLVLPGELTRRGTLMVGLPGSGKTTRFLERGVIAALRHPEAAVVVFAVQPGSARQALAAHQHLRPDSRIRPAVFNPGDAAACTHFINPIAGVHSRSEAMAIGQTLGQPVHPVPHSTDSDYFLQQATTMIGHAILAVNTLHGGRGALAMIREAIDGGPQALKALGVAGECAPLARFAGEIIDGNRNSETTLAQMSNCLQWLFQEDAALATSRQELNLDSLLLEQPGLLVLAVNEEEVPRQRALISLIFRNLFAWIISRARTHGGALPRPLYIFIDELPAAGRIPEFGLRLTATFRKSNVSVFAAAQCEAQLADVYGLETAAVLAGFGSRVYVPPIDFTDAERASERSGLIEVATHVTDSLGRILSTNPMVRPLLLPGEIASPPRDPILGPRLLFRLADMPPFFGHLRASWQIPAESVISDIAATLEPPRRPRPPDGEPGRVGDDRAVRALSVTRGWSRARITKRYRKVLAAIGHDQASDSTLRFWQKIERQHRSSPSALLRLAEEIALRDASLADFQQALLTDGNPSVPAALAALESKKKSRGMGSRGERDEDEEEHDDEYEYEPEEEDGEELPWLFEDEEGGRGRGKEDDDGGEVPF